MPALVGVRGQVRAFGRGDMSPRPKAASCPAPYTPLARAVPQVSNRLYRRFPNRQAVQGSKAPACGAATGFGNPRYRRLGSLRYQKAASSRPLHLKPMKCLSAPTGRPRSVHVTGGQTNPFGSAARPAPYTHLVRAVPLVPTCCIADFQIGRPSKRRMRQLAVPPPGLETRDTADLEVCATKKPPRPCRCI